MVGGGEKKDEDWIHRRPSRVNTDPVDRKGRNEKNWIMRKKEQWDREEKEKERMEKESEETEEKEESSEEGSVQAERGDEEIREEVRYGRDG